MHITVLPGYFEADVIPNLPAFFPEARLRICPACLESVLEIDLDLCTKTGPETYANPAGITYTIALNVDFEPNPCKHPEITELLSTRKQKSAVYLTTATGKKRLELRVNVGPEGKGFLSHKQIKRIRELEGLTNEDLKDLSLQIATSKGPGTIVKTKKGYLIELLKARKGSKRKAEQTEPVSRIVI